MDEKSLKVREIAQRAQWIGARTSLSHYEAMQLYGDIDVVVKREMAMKLGDELITSASYKRLDTPDCVEFRADFLNVSYDKFLSLLEDAYEAGRQHGR